MALAYSPDGGMLASGSEDHTVRIWNATTGKHLVTLNGHRNRVTALAWAPNGKMLASGSCDNRILVWDVSNWSAITTIDIHTNCVRSVAWNPNSSRLVSAYKKNSTAIWNTFTGEKIYSMMEGNVSEIYSAAWSPNGSVVAFSGNPTSGYGPIIDLWDADTGTFIRRIGGFMKMAWSPDGAKFATQSCNMSDGICIYDARNWTIVKTIVAPSSSGWVDAFDWSHDGRMIASVSDDNADIDIWDTTNGTNLKNLLNQGDPGGAWTSVVWNPTGKELASSTYPNNITIWGEAIPHVFVSSVAVDRIYFDLGDVVNITGILANDGTGDGLDVPVGFYDGATLLTTVHRNVVRGGTNSTIIPWRTTNLTEVGAHILRVIVDGSEKSITVIANDLTKVYLKALTVSKNSVTVGKSVDITGTIANDGIANASDVEVRLYDGPHLVETRTVFVPRRGTANVTLVWNTANVSLGKHTLKAEVGESSMKSVVSVGRGSINLNSSSSILLIVLIVVVIIIIAIPFMFNARRPRRRSHKEGKDHKRHKRHRL